MKFILTALFTLFSICVFAQQNHFIYIQSDNQQSFYVKLDKKIMSSTASGYLIIPKLKVGVYDFAIGFPKNEWPEQIVTCNIVNADAGYLLKNFGDKGWGLFNFQTMDLLLAKNKSVDENKEDPFANVLSKVVNDPSITLNNVKKTEIKPGPETVEKTFTVNPSINVENKTVIGNNVVKVTAVPVITEKEMIKTQPANEEDLVIKKPVEKLVSEPAIINNTQPVAVNETQISKLADNKNVERVSLVNVDAGNRKMDTINVIKPAAEHTVGIVPEIKKERVSIIEKPADKTEPANMDAPVIAQVEKKVEVESIVNLNFKWGYDLAASESTIDKVTQKRAGSNKDEMAVQTREKKKRQSVKNPLISKSNVQPKEQLVEPLKNKEVVIAIIDTPGTGNPQIAIIQSTKKEQDEPTGIVKNEMQTRVSLSDTVVIKPDQPEVSLATAGNKMLNEPKRKGWFSGSNKKTTDWQKKLEQREKKTSVDEPDVSLVTAENKKFNEPKRKGWFSRSNKKTKLPDQKERENKPVVNNNDNNADSLIAKDNNTIIKETITVPGNKVESKLEEKVNSASIIKTVITETPKEKITENNKTVIRLPLSNCNKYVDDDEYLNLRIKMNKGKRSENEMMNMAHKLFLKRCFNTRQIQRLSLLFTSEEGKYKFLDDAYIYTYDRQQFSTLESELKDPFYIQRFRAMLR